MGVSIPSDIVLDVMRNADPARLSVATGKLQSITAGEASGGFLDALNDAEQQPPLTLALDHGFSPSRKISAESASHGDYVAFERMVLRNLLESLLPDASSGTFGTGPSAGVWRSLAADQLAGLYAETGGIGIAASLSGSASGDAGETVLQWPYFSSGKIKAFAG